MEQEGIEVLLETVRKELLSCGLITKIKKPKHRQRRERMPKEGILLQMDTSEHDWLMGRDFGINLIAGIDDATNEVVYAQFVTSDNTLNNMAVMKGVVKRKGIPLGFYVDKASHFLTTRHGGTHVRIKEEQEDTQIERAVKELGSNLIFANSPQAKGRVERLFKTFQDRFVSEMNLKKISNIENANSFLHDGFLPNHNRKFAKTPQLPESAYIPLLKGKSLDTTFLS